MRVVYLHGFASGPQSGKARFFAAKFAEAGVLFLAPQLDEGNFEGLTISSQLRVIEDAVASGNAVAGEKSVLMGSSLGGYLAALYGARHPAEVEKLVLLAPAFQFPTRWRARYTEQELELWKRLGTIPFFHYSYMEERALGFQIVEDALQYEDEPAFPQPALVLHGRTDDVVPVEVSKVFAEGHPNVTLRIVESGHALTDVLEELWDQTSMFLGIPGPRNRAM